MNLAIATFVFRAPPTTLLQRINGEHDKLFPLPPITADGGRDQCGATGLQLPSRPTATFQTRMATAVCGLQSTGNNGKQGKTHREHRRKAKDSRRRQAALLFLNNISLDGRPQCQPSDGNTDRKAAEEQRLRDRDGAATFVPPPADSQEPVTQVTEPADAGSGSFSGFPAAVGPARLSTVISTGPGGATVVGANEVFLEGGGAAETLTPDTPLSPVTTGGHAASSRVRSAPAAISPVPAASSLDSRPR